MKIVFPFIAILILSSSVVAQDSDFSFYLNEMFEVTDKSSAVYVQHMTGADDNSFECYVHTLEGNKLKMVGTFIKIEEEFFENGRFTFYYPSGAVESSGFYVYGYKSGVWKRYDRKGNSRPERYYNPQLGKTIRKYKEQLAEM